MDTGTDDMPNVFPRGAEQTARREAKCPIDDGQFGTDYRIYGDECLWCDKKDKCKSDHASTTYQRQRAKPSAVPLRLEIPIGLMVPELDAIERGILALIYFRHIGGNDGISWDKNKTFAYVVGTTESTVSRRLDYGDRSLVTRGYVTSEVRRRRVGAEQPRKGARVEYRSSRELRLTVKTLRLINAYRRAEDCR